MNILGNINHGRRKLKIQQNNNKSVHTVFTQTHVVDLSSQEETRP